MIAYLAAVLLASIGGGLAGFAVGASLEGLYWSRSWRRAGRIR